MTRTGRHAIILPPVATTAPVAATVARTTGLAAVIATAATGPDPVIGTAAAVPQRAEITAETGMVRQASASMTIPAVPAALLAQTLQQSIRPHLSLR